MQELSTPLAHVTARIRAATAAWSAAATLDEIRTGFDTLFDPDPTPVTPLAIGDMPAAWFGAAGAGGGRVILFCHGGGYQVGSLRSHHSLMARLAAASDARVLGFTYRLAPEHRFPAAAMDAIGAYRWLLDQRVPARRIAVAGDSAGGALALGVAVQARSAGLPLPACLVLISPWLDLAMRGASYRERASLDVFSQPAQLQAMARTYLGRGGDPLHPLASPVEADLGGLPPVLVHAGDHDITFDDARLFVARAGAQGCHAQLRVWPGMFHHFQMFPELPQTRQSLHEIAAFLASHLPADAPMRA